MKVLSCDDEVFEICENTANLSHTIADLLEDLGHNNDEPIYLPKIKGKIMRKIDEFCMIHDDYVEMDQEEMKKLLESRRTNDISEDDANILSDMSHGDIFDLIMAANFLEIEILVNLGCKKIACIVKTAGKPEKIAEIFGYNLKKQITKDRINHVIKIHGWAEDDLLEFERKYGGSD